VVIVLIFFHPLAKAGNNILWPSNTEEIKPVLSSLKTQIQEDDIVCLYHGAGKAYLYYAERYGLEYEELVMDISSDNINKYIENLKGITGKKKVWIIFSHFDLKEYRFIRNYMRNEGQERLVLTSTGAAAHLFELQ